MGQVSNGKGGQSTSYASRMFKTRTLTDHFELVLLCKSRRSTSSWVGSGQLPGRIHHDDIELCGVDERGPVIGHDIGMDGDAVRRDLPLAGVQVVHIAQGEVNALLPLDIRKL
jgi:hypothetical protein